jgi:hypothetical protein
MQNYVVVKKRLVKGVAVTAICALSLMPVPSFAQPSIQTTHMSFFKIVKRIGGIGVLIDCLLDTAQCVEGARSVARRFLGIDDTTCVPLEALAMIKRVIENGHYSAGEKIQLLHDLEALKAARGCKNSPGQTLPEPPPTAPVSPPATRPLAMCRTNGAKLGSSSLTVRVGPHHQMPAMGRIPSPSSGIELVELASAGGWVRIRWGVDINGWVRGDYLICDG